jgi:hypothetical protein
VRAKCMMLRAKRPSLKQVVLRRLLAQGTA